MPRPLALLLAAAAFASLTSIAFVACLDVTPYPTVDSGATDDSDASDDGATSTDAGDGGDA